MCPLYPSECFYFILQYVQNNRFENYIILAYLTGLVLKGGEPQQHLVSSGPPPLIVQGSRTAVMVGGSSPGPPPPTRTTVPGGSPGSGKLAYPSAAAPLSPPGVDIDRVAAMLTSDKGRKI